MKNFEMIVKDVFNMSHNRTVFSGNFVTTNGLHLPMEVTIYVNEKPIGKVRLVTLPFSCGANVRKDIDSIESSDKIDLKFVNWGQDKVILKNS